MAYIKMEKKCKYFYILLCLCSAMSVSVALYFILATEKLEPGALWHWAQLALDASNKVYLFGSRKGEVNHNNVQATFNKMLYCNVCKIY